MNHLFISLLLFLEQKNIARIVTGLFGESWSLEFQQYKQNNFEDLFPKENMAALSVLQWSVSETWCG